MMSFFYGLVNLINITSIITVSIAVSTIFIGVFIYKPYRKENTDDTDSDEDMDYEYMYMDEYELLEKKTVDCAILDSYIDNFIDEKTPRGNVILTYDNKLSAFIYYSNSKDIPYKYLETVSRKFIVDNDCKQIYIDYRDELINGVNRYNDMIAKNENSNNTVEELDNEPSKKSVFAKFKEYNKNDRPVNTKKEYVLTENSNRYIYKGTLLDYDNYINDKEARNNSFNSEYENIDFKTFKQLQTKEKLS